MLLKKKNYCIIHFSYCFFRQLREHSHFHTEARREEGSNRKTMLDMEKEGKFMMLILRTDLS